MYINDKKGGLSLRYCTECGQELSEDAQFCVNCGTPITMPEEDSSKEDSDTRSDETTSSQSTVTSENETVEKSAEATKEKETLHKNKQQSTQAQPVNEVKKKEKSPLTKVLVGIIIFIVIALFGVHKWLENHFDPMNDLIAMDEAVTNKDMETFLSYIQFEDGALLDRESYFELIEESEWSETIRVQLFNVIENITETNNPLDSEIYDRFDEIMFRVKKENVFLGLYHKISIVAVPIKLKATSNLSETTLSILDETYEVNEDEETLIAEVYPGTYELKAESEQQFATLTFEQSYLISSRLDDTIYIEFDFVTYNVDATYGFEDAIVFVDGKSTEQKVSEISGLGPFAEGSNITIYAVAKDGNDYEIISSMINLRDDEPGFTLFFTFDDKYKVAAKGIDDDEVAQFILEFRSAYEDAVNYVDYDYISSYLKKDSAAAKELRQFVKDMDDGYYHYNFTENTVLNVKEEKKNKYTVKTNEKFEFRDDDFTWYDYDREKIYHVELIDDQLQLTKIEYKDTKKKKM